MYEGPKTEPRQYRIYLESLDACVRKWRVFIRTKHGKETMGKFPEIQRPSSRVSRLVDDPLSAIQRLLLVSH